MAAKLRILSIGNKKRHQKATIFKFFAIIIMMLIHLQQITQKLLPPFLHLKQWASGTSKE